MKNSYSEKIHENAQNRIMLGYKNRGAVRNEKQEEMLHMFFSPTRVPIGLTNHEIETVLILSPLRETQRAAGQIKRLPDELSLHKKSTAKTLSCRY